MKAAPVRQCFPAYAAVTMSKAKVILAAMVVALSIGAIAPASSAADLGSLVQKTEHDAGDTAFRVGDDVGDVMIGAAQMLGRTLNPR